MGTCVSRKSPSLRAPRAETRLTVYRALRSLARRDGDCFLCRRATFDWHNSGANSLQMCMRFFQKIWQKILNISRPCGQILMKSCPAGAKTMSIVILKARGPGKFCSSRTAGTKVGKIDKFLEKCPLVRDVSIFWALPGAHAPGRVHSPFKTIPYGS